MIDAAPPEIVTERLSLSRPALADVSALQAMWADPCVTRHLARPKDDGPEQDFERVLRNAGSFALLGLGFWTVRLRATGEILGQAGFRRFGRGMDPQWDDLPEAGWVFARAAHGKGYATEAVQAGLRWADARGLAGPILCMIDHGNTASFRVAAKTGFTPLADRDFKGGAVSILRRGT